MWVTRMWGRVRRRVGEMLGDFTVPGECPHWVLHMQNVSMISNSLFSHVMECVQLLHFVAYCCVLENALVK